MRTEEPGDRDRGRDPAAGPPEREATIEPIDPARLTDAQRAVFDRIAGTRGRVAGPFTVLLHVPELADRVQQLGAYLRYEAGIDRDLAETAVLATAVAWNSPFEWDAHEPLARGAGVPDVVLEILRSGGATGTTPLRYRVVIDYARELARRGEVSAPAYAATRQLLGTEGLVELTVLVGYYTLLAMTLGAHGIEAPDDRTAFGLGTHTEPGSPPRT
jgi:4-carboxymuconolactone decarboxylase